MPWLTQPREPTLAELFGSGAISGGGGISSGLLRPPPNQWEEALAKILPAIKEAIQKKKSDEIANQLQNMYQPPRAEAVDPRAYNPALAASQGLDYQPQATMPFTGGADQFQVAEMYRKTQEAAEDRKLKRRQVEAQISAKGESSVPVEINGRTVHVTPNAALEHFRAIQNPDGLTAYQRERLRISDTDKLHKSIPPYSRALRRGKIDEDGDFTNNYEGAATGDMAEVETPDGSKIIVPWSEYERATKGGTNPAARNYQEIQQKAPQQQWKESPSEDFRPTTTYDVPEAPKEPAKREKGKVYATPRGNLRWTGTGWVTS